ncbi:MAG: LPS export ABC transporter periplasmic protein LptC [Phycisphaerae bacterium]|nr:LPS export ABC transporter periplasmic protein LptC [Phycisphaerae bacterium]
MTVPIARPPRARPLLLIGGGVLVGAILLLVVSNLDYEPRTRPESRRIDEAKDLVGPAPLTESERLGRTQSADAIPLMHVEDGAWVQVTDENGRLAQQYSAQSLEPLPDGEMKLTRPKALMFQPDGRVIVLTADRGRARRSGNELESGTLDGNVVIRVFRPRPDGLDIEVDAPAMTALADDARFDSILGDIRCEGPVHIESDAGTFDGEGMSLLVTPTGQGKGGARGGELESLTIDRSTKPIVFVRGADGRTRPAGARTTPVAPAKVIGGAPASAAPATAPAAPKFYRLTLADDVHVTRVNSDRTSHLRGDELIAVFALEGESHDRIASGASLPSNPSNPARAIGAAAFAAQSTTGEDASLVEAASVVETITIEYTGRLVLEPAGAADRLASKDDARVEIIARDGRRVTLDDEATKAHVSCARVQFQTGEDLVEAFGSSTAPLTVDSPQLNASGERFWLRQREGKGGFTGPGSVVLASGGEAFALLAADPDDAAVTRDADGALALTQPQPAQAPSSVTITWREELALQFSADATGTGDLEHAAFKGNVRATGESFVVDAAKVDAHFGARDNSAAPTAGDRAGTGALEQLKASGDDTAPAIARRTHPATSLSARTLDLALRRDARGDAAPAKLVAQHNVEAIDPEQRLWTSKLTVRFRDDVTTASTTAPRDDKAIAADISTVEAQDGVQALLLSPDEPHVRVFADALDGDGVAHDLTVSGDVWVVRERVLIDRMTELTFHESTRSASAEGPGRVRSFANVIAPPTMERIERPVVPESAAMTAEWQNGFVFRERLDEGEPRAEDGRGAIDLHGSVTVRSTPDRASTDAVSAEHLRFEITDQTAPKAPKDNGISRVVAKSAATFFSSRWSSSAREGDPRLFRLRGEHIEYDLVTREGFVEGPGTLLTNVPAKAIEEDESGGTLADESLDAPPADGTEEKKTTPLALGAEGITNFKWTRRLDMVNTETDRATITLLDDVELTHTDPEPRTGFFTLTGSSLEADLERLAPDPTTEPAERGVDFGGTSRILGVRAFGDGARRIYITSGKLAVVEFAVECDGFAYDVETQIATLTGTGTGAGSRSVKVTQGNGTPVLAARVTWNMETGTLRIEDASGAVIR